MHPTLISFETMDPFSVVIPVSEPMSEYRRILLQWVIDRYLVFPEATIILGEDDSQPFNRSRARNEGLRLVRDEIVLIADGDTAFDYTAVVDGITLLQSGAPWVIPYGDADYYNLTESYTKSILDNPIDPITNPDWDFRIKSWAGLLLARVEDCRTIGLYDENFVGWGWEDVAFRIKMDAHIGRHRRVEGRALHLWHPRGNDEFNSPTEQANRLYFDEHYRRPYNWRDERVR